VGVFIVSQCAFITQKMVMGGQRLLLQVRKGDRRLSQTCALAVPDLQEDMVRELPQAEDWLVFQEASVP
jgi:hypothetical protein